MSLIVNTTTPLREYLAGEIRAEVARQKMQKSAIAAALNIVPATLSRKLAGEQPIHNEELDCLAEILGVPMSEFVARAEARREADQTRESVSA